MDTIEPLNALGLREYIREIPDFPKPGISFKDVTPLLQNPHLMKKVMNALILRAGLFKPDVIIGMEARGFLFAPTVAYVIGAGFVPVRKPKKLPAETVAVTYDLEYGTDTLEMHKDAIQPGQKVVIVDDLLATGGTAKAVVKLVEQCGGEVIGALFVVELLDLKGREALGDSLDVSALVQY